MTTTNPPRSRLLLLVTALLVALPAASPASPASAAACGTVSARDFDGDGEDDAVVGDPFAEVAGKSGAGAVHVLHGRGDQTTVLTAPEPTAGDAFGWAVTMTDLDGDGCADVVVGAPYADVDGRTDAGAVFVLYGGAQRPPKRLVATEPQQDAHFGWSLASHGATLAVGAPHEDADDAADSGAVHVFLPGEKPRRITQDTKQTRGNSEVGDMFGWAIALGRLDGDPELLDLAVGVPYENNDGDGKQVGEGVADTGTLIVVNDIKTGDYAGTRWELPDVVEEVDGTLPAKETEGDRFGYALAYAEFGGQGHLAVSAPLANVRDLEDTGLVHVFRAENGTGLRKDRTFYRTEGEAAKGEAFGFSLAVSSEQRPRLAVGIPFAGEQLGAVQITPLTDGTAPMLINGDAVRSDRHLGWSVAFSGNRLLVGAPSAGSAGSATFFGRNESAAVPLTPSAPPDGTSVDFGAAAAG